MNDTIDESYPQRDFHTTAKVHHNAPMPNKGARAMNDKSHNMGNKNNAHKTPNREIAQNTRNNHGGSSHFGGRR